MEELASSAGSEIAVVGMACRFPAAKNVEEFWRNIKDGVESISFFSDDELRASGVDGAMLRDPNYVKARGILKDIDLFDASFFDFSPREAEIIDPQHRLFLECAWQSLEAAGCDAETFQGLIGVYAGASLSRYLFNIYTNRRALEVVGTFQAILGNDKDHLPTRTSYKLNLRGPSVAVQSSCSTSLVAVHLACQGLLSGDCDLALAGGVSISSPEVSGYLYHQGGILSPDGHCRAFDRRALGTVSGNGVGVVVLKRLADALADGDTIEAVIKGTAVNNDGGTRVGYTSPRVDGQADVIAAAQAMAEVEPETISYVETHGTGTPLGDTIEMAALNQVFRAATREKGVCAIGSVKTNVGHLDTAAGVAGFIKTVLALKHKMIPPSLHFEQPNPEIDLEDSPFYVNTELRPWPEGRTPRRAGVSSFGVGGTNAHVVLEEAPPPRPSGASKPWQVLVLSAKTDSALKAMSLNLAAHLKSHPDLNLGDVAHTLRTGRRSFRHHGMLVCRSAEEAVKALEAGTPEQSMTTNQGRVGRPAVAFAFPGLGEHYVQMGRGLYRTEAVFRQQVDLCAELLKPHLGLNLCDLLYPGDGHDGQSAAGVEPAGGSGRRIDLRQMLRPSRGQAGADAGGLNQTHLAHTALFAVEYALARLWMSWGVQPQAFIGYSIGEYVAACLAGVFSLEDALTLVTRRAQIIEKLPAGAMLAVALSEEQLRPFWEERLSLSALNGPSLSVVSGTHEAIEELELKLKGGGVVSRRVEASHAFHSRTMAVGAESFAEEVKKIKLDAPQIPYVSTLTGTWITAAEATSVGYWTRHLCEPVRFAEGVSELWKEKSRALLEVGPGQTLTSFALQHPARDPALGHLALPSMRPPYDRQADEAFLLNALGKLWLAGTQVDWDSFGAGEQRRKVALPTYPFERQRYWIGGERRADGDDFRRASPSSREGTDAADLLYRPSWRQSPLPSEARGEGLFGQKSCWLIFADECGVGARLADSLEAHGQDVFRVRAGEDFGRPDDRTYVVNPAQSGHYYELLGGLGAQGRRPEKVVHLWGVRPGDNQAGAGAAVEKALELGFHSLISLVQAHGRQNPGRRLDIEVVTNLTRQVIDGEQLHPERATVLGACKVIPQEYPEITCRSIDIHIPEDASAEERVNRQLTAELAAAADKGFGNEIAYRGDGRWVQGFEAVRLDGGDGPPARLREGGVYLITGGLGGIGLELAEYLARTVHAKLILTGRSAFPAPEEWEQWLAAHPPADETSRKIRRLRALEELGAEVAVFSADVADREQMSAVVGKSRERFGQVNGVIHAAGVAGGGIIALKTAEAAAQVLAPKVQGTLVLDSLFRGAGLDFLALCSSLSSFAGGPGQVDYCAANIFLDAFARSRREGFTVSINWDTWRDVGMIVKADLPRHLQEMREAGRRYALPPRDAVEAFKRILTASLPQVIVSMRDFRALPGSAAETAPSHAQTATGQDERPISMHRRPLLSIEYVAPGDEVERTVAAIWQELLGIEQVGVNDNFFELGGHSLLAIRLVSKLRESFGVELPLHVLLESLTVKALAELIKASRPGDGDLSKEGADGRNKEGGLEAAEVGTAAQPQAAPRASNYLVELQRGPSKRPLFLIHPAGGTVFCYRDLALDLGRQQAVYGVQARGVVDDEAPFTSIEGMAIHYLEEIRAVQPEGPYQLAGLSQGGTVAFEMAQQLQAKGERVALLALFDTPGPGQMPDKVTDDAETFVRLFGNQLSVPPEHLRQFEPDEQVTYVFERLKAAGTLPDDIGPAEARRLLNIWKSNMQALEKYVPEKYPGRILFFRAAEWLTYNPRHPELPWIDLAADGIEIHIVPGNHHTMMNNPHVKVLARLLKSYLFDLDERERSRAAAGTA